MLRLWSRREYGSLVRSGKGVEDVPEALVPVVEALRFGSEASPFVGLSEVVLAFILEREANSVAGEAGEAACGSDDGGGGGVLRVSRMLCNESG